MVEETIMFMKNEIELKNYDLFECCLLNKNSGAKQFYEDRKIDSFTGVYFKDEHTFFACYPTTDGPMIYFKGKEYPISKDLTISFTRDGNNRIFKIEEYGIQIHRIAASWGWDWWESEEKDVDLFCKIEQDYKMDHFYEWMTL